MNEKQGEISTSRKACLDSLKGLTDDEILQVMNYALKIKSKRNKAHVGEQYKNEGSANN